MYDKLRLLFKPCNTHFYKDKLYKNNKAEIDKNLENNSQKNNLNIVKVIFGDVIRSSIGVYIINQLYPQSTTLFTACENKRK